MRHSAASSGRLRDIAFCGASGWRLFALADGTKLRVGDDGYLTAILPATRISIR